MPNQDSPIRPLRPGESTTAVAGATPAPSIDSGGATNAADPQASRSAPPSAAPESVGAADGRRTSDPASAAGEMPDDVRTHTGGPDAPSGPADEGTRSGAC